MIRCICLQRITCSWSIIIVAGQSGGLRTFEGDTITSPSSWSFSGESCFNPWCSASAGSLSYCSDPWRQGGSLCRFTKRQKRKQLRRRRERRRKGRPEVFFTEINWTTREKLCICFWWGMTLGTLSCMGRTDVRSRTLNVAVHPMCWGRIEQISKKWLFNGKVTRKMIWNKFWPKKNNFFLK